MDAKFLKTEVTLRMHRNCLEKTIGAIFFILFPAIQSVLPFSESLGGPVAPAGDSSFADVQSSQFNRPSESVGSNKLPIAHKQFGAQLTRVPEVVRHQLLLSHNEGLVIESVHKGSIAERLGFKPHDILVQFDDQYLLLPEQFSLLLESSVSEESGPEDQLSEIIFIRSGRHRVISLLRSHQDRSPDNQVAEARLNHGGHDQRSTDSVTAVPPDQIDRKTILSAGIEGTELSSEPVVLLREDADYTIQMTQGEAIRLEVYSRDKKCVIDQFLTSQESLQAIPASIRLRVDSMLRVLETYANSSHKQLARPSLNETREAPLPVASSIEKQQTLRR